MSNRNENKPGYKKTKIGWLPEDWDITKLEKIAQFKNGVNFLKIDEGYKYRIIGVAGFQNNFIPNEKSYTYVDVKDKLSQEYFLELGDLLFVRSNGNKALIGRCLYIDKVLEETSFSGFTIRARIETNEVISIYIAFYFLSKTAKKQIALLGGGTNINNLSQSILANIIIPLPPLPEQKKIAQILSAWDKAIDQVQKLIAAKKQLKKGLMQQLLTGRVRFGEFGDHETHETHEKGEEFVPDGWETIKLKELCNIYTGKKDVNEGDLSGKYPFFTCAKKITYSNDYSYDTEAILISGNGAGVGYTHYYKGKFEAYQRTYILDDFDNIIDVQFLLFLLENNIKKEIHKEKQDSAMPYIRLGLLENFKLLLPPKNEQKKITNTLSSCENEINLLTKKEQSLQQQKKGLMQKLLTGEVRVNHMINE